MRKKEKMQTHMCRRFNRIESEIQVTKTCTYNTLEK